MTASRFAGRKQVADIEAQEEPIEERLQLLALGQLVAGAEQRHQRALDGRAVVVEDALVHQGEQRVQDGAVGLEDFVDERELRLRAACR